MSDEETTVEAHVTVEDDGEPVEIDVDEQDDENDDEEEQGDGGEG